MITFTAHLRIPRHAALWILDIGCELDCFNGLHAWTVTRATAEEYAHKELIDVRIFAPRQGRESLAVLHWLDAVLHSEPWRTRVEGMICARLAALLEGVHLEPYVMRGQGWVKR